MLRLLLICSLFVVANRVGADEPLLRSGDRVALVGGTVVERMQAEGGFESQLHCRQPAGKISVRNLGWSGDTVTGIARKRFDTPADGYARLLADVDMAKPSLVLLMYGFSEASDGLANLDTFENDLQKLIGDLTQPDRRLVLIQPFPLSGIKTEDYARSMQKVGAMINDVAKSTGTPVIDLAWVPGDDDLTVDQLQLSASGHVALGSRLAKALLPDSTCDGVSPNLTDAIVRKNELYFHRYRPQNETYLFLFRKHEQGNNAAEVEQFEKLADEADVAIWAMN